MQPSMVWSSPTISLESLRPLSPDNFEDGHIASDVADKLSRSELAGKLLEHFDGIQDEESDPFGWYANEKSVEIPIFESLPSPPYTIELKPPTQDSVYLHTAAINAGNYAEEPAPQQPLYHPSPLLAEDPYNPLPSFYSSLSPAQHFEPAPAVVPLAQPSPLADPINDVAGYPYGQLKDECEPAADAEVPANSNAEWLKRETLTPPDSPKEEEILKMLEEIESAEFDNLMANANQFISLPTFTQEPPQCASPATFSDDGDDDDNDYVIDESSRASSPSGDDPEWSPPARQSTRGSGRRTSKFGATPKSASTAAAKRRSTKPYSRPAVEDRRERKKEQNKNAATRYRLKKKAEVEEVKHEEVLLEETNAKLHKEVDELCREIRYLKSLMRDVYRRKGLIK